MSTFTTIRTCIRDADAMYRTLQTIPGARVLRDVMIPAGVGRAAQIPFVVQLTGAQASGFWGTITKNVQYFIVVKEADGTLSIKIDQDQGTHRDSRCRAKGNWLGRRGCDCRKQPHP
jgi:hypothetical protein